MVSGTGPNGPDGERRLAGRYLLLSVLGRGGMGVVWAAQDELLHRPVAIKEVLSAPGLSAEQVALMRRRTLQEARAAARLSSPAAVLVYDVVEQDGEPWVVMERLAGRTLADVLDEHGPLAPRDVATLGLRLLDALDAAHAVGVMHRDVKPANVMFRGGADMANAVLTDFGIARFDGDPATTATGTLIGSPAFVAPERARGDQARPASDLWSLGITLWIAAEGVSPFHRDGTLQTLTAVLTADPPPVRRAGPLTPALTGLLAKDPDERLDSRSLRTLLRRIAGPVPGATRHEPDTTVAMPLPAPAASRPAPAAAEHPDERDHRVREVPALPDLSPPARRHSRPWLLAGLVAVLLAASGAALLSMRDDPTSTRASGTPTSPAPSSPSPSTEPSTSTSSTTTTSSSPTSSSTTTSPTRSATSSPTATSPSRPASSSATPEAGSVPAGMRRYTDRTGFSVAVPEGWRADRRGNRVYLRDSASSAFLLVDQTTEPAGDPVADWRAQEKVVSRRLSNYRLIGIRPVTVGKWQGADWEFTHGRSTHVLNRALVTGSNRAYALYWSAPDAGWDRSMAEFERVSASFQPGQ